MKRAPLGARGGGLLWQEYPAGQPFKLEPRVRLRNCPGDAGHGLDEVEAVVAKVLEAEGVEDLLPKRVQRRRFLKNGIQFGVCVLDRLGPGGLEKRQTFVPTQMNGRKCLIHKEIQCLVGNRPMGAVEEAETALADQHSVDTGKAQEIDVNGQGGVADLAVADEKPGVVCLPGIADSDLQRLRVHHRQVKRPVGESVSRKSEIIQYFCMERALHAAEHLAVGDGRIGRADQRAQEAVVAVLFVRPGPSGADFPTGAHAGKAAIDLFGRLVAGSCLKPFVPLDAQMRGKLLPGPGREGHRAEGGHFNVPPRRGFQAGNGDHLVHVPEA